MGFPASPRGLLAYFLTLHVLRLGSAEFRVVGPRHPLLASVGQDMVLPCHLSPPMDAGSLEIKWIRRQFSEIVHVFRNGQDQPREQMEEYIGRTELSRDGLSTGSLDLRIRGLRPSDDGLYVCTVQDGASYKEAMVELEVAATGSVPRLSLEAYEDGGIRVLCRSAGWYPQPEVLWQDGGGQRLPSLSQGRSSDERGLLEIRDVIVVSGKGDGDLSCVVRNSRLAREQASSLHISAPFFHNARPWMAALGVFLPLLVLSCGVIACLWRRKAAQSRELEKKAALLEEQAALLGWTQFLLTHNPDVMTLDPDTAHSELVLSEDLRSPPSTGKPSAPGYWWRQRKHSCISTAAPRCSRPVASPPAAPALLQALPALLSCILQEHMSLSVLPKPREQRGSEGPGHRGCCGVPPLPAGGGLGGSRQGVSRWHLPGTSCASREPLGCALSVGMTLLTGSFLPCRALLASAKGFCGLRPQQAGGSRARTRWPKGCSTPRRDVPRSLSTGAGRGPASGMAAGAGLGHGPSAAQSSFSCVT